MPGDVAFRCLEGKTFRGFFNTVAFRTMRCWFSSTPWAESIRAPPPKSGLAVANNELCDTMGREDLVDLRKDVERIVLNTQYPPRGES